MNLPFFIAKRISNNEQGSFSTVINRIAVISIAIALVALIGCFTILKGFEDTIKQKIYSFSGHLVVSKYTLSTSFEESAIVVNDSVKAGIEALQGVDYLQTHAYKAGLLKTEEEVHGIVLKGLDKRFDTSAFGQHMIVGSFPVFPETGYGKEIAISKRISSYLNLNVGDQVVVFFIQDPPRFRKLKISGIYETGLEDFDERFILGDINLVRRLNDWGDETIGGMEIFLDNPDDMDAAETMVFEATDTDLYVDKVSDKYEQIFDWLRLLNRNVVIFFTLIFFVTAFNMVSILLILIMERTQMVGVLKSLGASNQLIRRIFFFNGLNLIVKGIFWGNLIALSFCWIQSEFKLLPLDPANYYMNHVPIDFNLSAVLLINLSVILAIAAALSIPLAVISRIDPIKSVKFD